MANLWLLDDDGFVWFDDCPYWSINDTTLLILATLPTADTTFDKNDLENGPSSFSDSMAWQMLI